MNTLEGSAGDNEITYAEAAGILGVHVQSLRNLITRKKKFNVDVSMKIVERMINGRKRVLFIKDTVVDYANKHGYTKPENNE